MSELKKQFGWNKNVALFRQDAPSVMMKLCLGLGLTLALSNQVSAATIYAAYIGLQNGVAITDEDFSVGNDLPMPSAPAAIADGVHDTFYEFPTN